MIERAGPVVLRRTGRHAIVVAHRGASARVAENTLHAFEMAWEAGAVWVEADTQPTADGVPIILHDEHLDRTTSGSGPVREHSAAEVARLDVLDLPGASVPELAQALTALTAQRALLLEIKGEHTTEQVSALLAAVHASRWADRVLLQSFEVPVLNRLAELEPGRQFGLLVEHLDDDPVARCRRLGAVGYHPEYRTVIDHPEVVTPLRGAGCSVAVWTADDPADWARLTAAGVDAIITNTPADLLAWQARAQRTG